MKSFFQSIANFFRTLFGMDTVSPNFPPIITPNPPVSEPEKPISPNLDKPIVENKPQTPNVSVTEEKPVIPEVPVIIPEVSPINQPEIPIENPDIKEIEITVNPDTTVVPQTDKPEEAPLPEPVSLSLGEETPLSLQLKLKRTESGEKETIGTIVINGVIYGYTLEDSKTGRIPAGRYEIKLRTAGGIHATYTIRYKEAHKGMLCLQDVPGFKYIYIQIGQDASDTQGCVVVGGAIGAGKEGRIVLKESKSAYYRIYTPIADYLVRGGKVFILVEDE